VGPIAHNFGVVALGSLIALVWQNLLMVEQNKFLQQQVQETQRQFEAQRRTQVIAYLYEEVDGRPQANARTRAGPGGHRSLIRGVHTIRARVGIAPAMIPIRVQSR
jgi:hypothetical protein